MVYAAQEVTEKAPATLFRQHINPREDPATMSAIPSAAHDTANTVEGTPMTLTVGENLGGPAPTTTSSPSGAYIPCESLAAGLGAFCLPTNGSVVYVGTTYYVTWDYRYFDGRNSSIYIMADYVNTTGGNIAYQSPVTAVGTGFIAWTVQKEWLQSQRSNNITLYINEINQSGSPRVLGPTVMVTNAPGMYYRQPPTQLPTGQSLVIALPIVFIFILICVIGGCYLNRGIRKIGLGNIMGRRGGYGIGRSRRQRLRNKDHIQLQERALVHDGTYYDPSVDEEGLVRQD